MAAVFTRDLPKSARITFVRDEAGNLTILSLFLFVLMVMMGGVAMDLMKRENVRTQMSQTLDRCALMAASLDQRLDPQSVVEDCIEKAGLANSVTAINVVDGANSRDVQITARANANPFFMHMIGIDDLIVAEGTRAGQSITNLELSLVLDVSGSMAGAKLANLKSAASDFVQTILDNDTGNRSAIALVPYNGQVNLGAALRGRFNGQDNHGVADVNCIDLPNGVYASSALSQTLPMPMTAHADSFSTTDTGNYYTNFGNGWAVPDARNRWCPPTTANVVQMPNNDIASLQAQINGMTAIGATSTNAGMKWGLTLLDPASRPMFNQMAAQNAMNNDFADRPFAYDDEQTMKVIVLMTDGEHFAEERINNGFRMGVAPIWRANGTGEYSILHPTRPGANKHYVPHLNVWRSTPFSSGSGATQQRWQDIWANQRITWVAWQLYARALGNNNASRAAQYNTAMDMIRTKTPTTSMDSQLQQACTLAKDNDVIVYGIAFEAPANGQVQIEQCASSRQHYFNAQGLSIATAFETIANNLTMLKLTQ